MAEVYMNTTEGKVRLATYEEVKKMMSNGSGGKLVWTTTIQSSSHEQECTYDLSNFQDYDYIVIYRPYIDYLRSYSLFKGCNIKIDSTGSNSNSIVFTLSVSGKSLSSKYDSSLANENEYFDIEAYKYD